MNIQEELLRSNDISFDETVRAVIGQLIILDFGVIRAVNELFPDGEEFGDGVYADVQLMGGQLLTNVEVCFIGNQANAVDSSPTRGDPVLVFGLRNKVTSAEEMLSEQTEAYGEETCKCITLGKIHSSLCNLVMSSGIFLDHELAQFGIDNAGVLRKKLGGSVNESEEPDGSYLKQYKNRRFEVRDEDGVVEEKLYDSVEADRKIIEYRKTDLDGSLEEYRNEITTFEDAWAEKKWGFSRNRNIEEKTDTIIYKNADNMILMKNEYSEEDGSFTSSLYEQSEDGEDFLVVFSQNPDGSLDRLQTSDGSEAVNHISVDADGTTTIDVGGGQVKLVLNPDGSFTWDLEDGFTLTVTGAVMIEGKDTVDIKSGGDMGITSGGALNIEGASGTVVKDGASIEINGAQVTITGGALQVDGSAAPSGSGPFCGIPACLFTGAPHVGNMVSGT